MKKSKVTVYEIAKKAGVSIATISRAFDPASHHKVAPHTLERIDKWAQKLRYTPSLAAKRLSKSKYETIGVVFPHHKGILESDYYSKIISGVADALLDSNYRTEMVLLKPTEKGWDHYDFQHGEGLDGLIMTYWRTCFKNEQTFRTLQIPAVIINNVEPDIHARFVAGDHFQGGKMAAEHLYNHGHRKIVVMSGNYGAQDVKERLNGFRTFLKDKGILLDERSLIDVNFEKEKAYQMTEQLVLARSSATAIFCMNDNMANGVLQKLNEMKVPCPGRFSVMGYDDDRLSQFTAPPLDSIHVPVYELAKIAAEDMVRHLNHPGEKGFYAARRFPVSLVARGSVRKI